MRHSSQFTALLLQYEPLIKALVELFHPFLEAAVHDLEQGKLVKLYHNISKRSVGEKSPLHEFKVTTADFPDYFSPYYKQNWDGKALKCTSITMRNTKGVAIGLICFNFDTSVFQDGIALLTTFLKTKNEAANPVEIYGSNSEEQIAQLIQNYLKKKELSQNHLTRNQKIELVQELYRRGVFNFKNAAPFISKTLNTSRATIYNYIKQLETKF